MGTTREKTRHSTPAKRKAGKPRRTTREAVTMVLRELRGDAPEGSTAAEVYAIIRKRRLAPGLKGETPEATVAAVLSTTAKENGAIERVTPGRYRLAHVDVD